MSEFDDNLSLLEEFSKWQAQKSFTGNDITPEAFLQDRIKTEAVDRLSQIEELINSYPASSGMIFLEDKDLDDPEIYPMYDAELIGKIKAVLNGDF